MVVLGLMGTLSDQGWLRWQYRDSSNLSARANLHTRFSTEEYPWFHWVFDRFDIPENACVLELGCGTGLLWLENLVRVPASWKITLSDASQGMVHEAQLSLCHAGPQFAFAKIDAKSIPYERDKFDVVIANHMLYHVPDLGRVLSEIHRVLKPQGILYATTVGPTHMVELRELPEDMGIGTSFSGHQFNLDNGAGQLGNWFPSVQVERRKDALVVTEAAPLVEYVMSYAQPSDERTVKLHAYFNRQIQLKGAFRITAEVGIFKAAKLS